MLNLNRVIITGKISKTNTDNVIHLMNPKAGAIRVKVSEKLKGKLIDEEDAMIEGWLDNGGNVNADNICVLRCDKEIENA